MYNIHTYTEYFVTTNDDEGLLQYVCVTTVVELYAMLPTIRLKRCFKAHGHPLGNKQIAMRTMLQKTSHCSEVMTSDDGGLKASKP